MQLLPVSNGQKIRYEQTLTSAFATKTKRNGGDGSVGQLAKLNFVV
jgi:hypothetical protein